MGKPPKRLLELGPKHFLLTSDACRTTWNMSHHVVPFLHSLNWYLRKANPFLILCILLITFDFLMSCFFYLPVITYYMCFIFLYLCTLLLIPNNSDQRGDFTHYVCVYFIYVHNFTFLNLHLLNSHCTFNRETVKIIFDFPQK